MDGPPLTIRAARSPSNTLIGVAKRTAKTPFWFPSRVPSEIRERSQQRSSRRECGSKLCRHLRRLSCFLPIHPRLYHFVRFTCIGLADWILLGKVTEGPKPRSAARLHVTNHQANYCAWVLVSHPENRLITRMHHLLSRRRKMSRLP